MVAASLGPTLPGLAENTGSDIAQISYLFTARSFGYLLGSLRGGRAFDRVKGQSLMAGLLFCMAGMMALVPLARSLWFLAALLLILGLSEGAIDVGGNTLLVWVHRERVGPYMSALHFFFGIGALIAPLIAAQFLLRTNEINWVLLASSFIHAASDDLAPASAQSKRPSYQPNQPGCNQQPDFDKADCIVFSIICRG